MKSQTYHLELLTPCFCAGADQSRAEIRSPSIRGQLRWWFRTLGGFKSMVSMPLSAQEAAIFGSAAGDEGTASLLTVRVTQPNIASVEKTGDSPEANVRIPTGYFLFPLRNKTRGAIEGGQFALIIQWRGPAILWLEIQNLVAVFTHIGSLGFRSRRGYGAVARVADHQTPISIHQALVVFNNSAHAIRICTLADCRDGLSSLTVLANWLKGWRAHGRSSADLVNGRPKSPATMPGFNYAKADHDAGYGINPNGPTYRAALGLPIIQRCDRTINNWELTARRGEGRFASPVLLRPHLTTSGQILPLVIFVNAHAWPKGNLVYLNNQPRIVATDLYEAMQNDPLLKPLTV